MNAKHMTSPLCRRSRINTTFLLKLMCGHISRQTSYLKTGTKNNVLYPKLAASVQSGQASPFHCIPEMFLSSSDMTAGGGTGRGSLDGTLLHHLLMGRGGVLYITFDGVI